IAPPPPPPPPSVRWLPCAPGARATIDTARRFGLAGPFQRDATLALGTGEVTLLDLVAAYAPFANGGLLPEPRGIVSARADGRAVAAGRPTLLRVTTPERAAAMRRMLEAVVARGSGRLAQPPGLRAVAGKTGTTQDFRDAWFIGLAPGADGSFVVGVWLGNDDATPMQDVRGGTLPARLFREVAEALAQPAPAVAGR
ncbi:penicillin-binding transpeptidase domain-containing protein, partial [Falsiroseomonas sp. E2-1-a20]|uniref:penicillin-binding transpeptidase domain-containing protein n=1 Tax=Falsiroseomonas sp. E2-1-a20 TaxID=3239300 RepID=UPI003F3C4B07